MATLLPFLVAQIPRLFGLNTQGHAFIAIAAAIAVLGLVGYCIYQVGDLLCKHSETLLLFPQHCLVHDTVLLECRLRLLGFKKGGSNLLGKDTGEAMLFIGRPIFQDHRAGVVFLNAMVNPMRRF